jgi:hypothetical protein
MRERTYTGKPWRHGTRLMDTHRGPPDQGMAGPGWSKWVVQVGRAVGRAPACRGREGGLPACLHFVCGHVPRAGRAWLRAAAQFHVRAGLVGAARRGVFSLRSRPWGLQPTQERAFVLRMSCTPQHPVCKRAVLKKRQPETFLRGGRCAVARAFGRRYTPRPRFGSRLGGGYMGENANLAPSRWLKPVNH